MNKAFFLILLSISAFSQSFIRLMPEKEKIEMRLDAALKVEGKYKNEVMFRATAFFISKDGYIIATNHMLEKYRQIGDSKNWIITFSDRNGNEYNPVNIIKCSDKVHKLDICLLKFNGKIKSKWIPIEESHLISPGTDNENTSSLFNFNIIGNPIGKDFERAEISLINLKKDQLGIHECGLKASDHNDVPIMEIMITKGSPREGFSGSPLIDSSGRLVGMWKGLRSGLYNPKTNKCDRSVHIAVPAKQLLDFFNQEKLTN